MAIWAMRASHKAMPRKGASCKTCFLPWQVLMVTWDVLASHEAMRAWHAERLSAHAADLAGLRAARARLHARLVPDPNPKPVIQLGSGAAAHEAAEGGAYVGLSAADRLQADCAVQVRVGGTAGKLHGERLGALTGVAAASMRPAGLSCVDQAGAPEGSGNHKDALHELQVRRECSTGPTKYIMGVMGSVYRRWKRKQALPLPLPHKVPMHLTIYLSSGIQLHP